MTTSLVSALSSMVAAIPSGSKQGFSNVVSMSMFNDNEVSNVNVSGSQLLTFIIVFVLSIWLLMFLGARIFNTSIPHIFPSVRKITLLEFFGLYIVCHILFT